MMNEFEKVHNNLVEETSKMFDVEQEVKPVNDLEILPINSYVLVKPYSKNPYMKINLSEAGLAMNTNEPKLFNSDTGETDVAETWEQVGSVVEVSPSCKYAKVGDDIFYRKLQAVPVNFLGLGLEVVAENQILVLVNNNLKKRFDL